MKTFKKHLKKELQKKEFKKLFQEEKELLNISLKILEARSELGISQKELAKKAHITQQQLSKVENGINCNMATFLKVCNALDMKIGIKKVRI